jgi:hypothetical protein
MYLFGVNLEIGGDGVNVTMEHMCGALGDLYTQLTITCCFTIHSWKLMSRDGIMKLSNHEAWSR